MALDTPLGVVELVVVGVWPSFDDNKSETADCFRHHLELLAEVAKECRRRCVQFAFVGNWNADIGRQKRFDRMLREFISQNLLFSPAGSSATHTYYKKMKNATPSTAAIYYSARLDYIMIPAEAVESIRDFKVVRVERETSDHRPVLIKLSIDGDETSGCHMRLRQTA